MMMLMILPFTSTDKPVNDQQPESHSFKNDDSSDIKQGKSDEEPYSWKLRLVYWLMMMMIADVLQLWTAVEGNS